MFRHLILVVLCSSSILAMNEPKARDIVVENCLEKFLTRVRIFDSTNTCIAITELKPDQKASFNLFPADISFYIEYFEQDKFKHLDTIEVKKDEFGIIGPIWITD